MGKVDMGMKSFLKIPEIFAQLFNGAVFGGQEEIKPDELYELDTVKEAVVELPEAQLDYTERSRDVVKMSKSGVSFRIILGIEEQTDIHYYMPVRGMLLDALSYDSQCRQIAAEARERDKDFRYVEGVPKGTKIIPVISIILYVGSKKWDGPTQLYDMFDIPKERSRWAGRYIRNYPINLIDVRHMSRKQIERFSGDVKAFFNLLSNKFDEKKVKETVVLHKETWYAVSAVKNDNRYVEYINALDGQGRDSNMDVLDYVEERGLKRGKQQVLELYKRLRADGRIEDWNSALDEQSVMEKLLEEYELVAD